MFRFQDQCFVIYETRIGLFDWVTLSGSLLITGLKIIFILCFEVLLIWPIPVKRRNDVIFYRHFSVHFSVHSPPSSLARLQTKTYITSQLT